MSYRRGKLGRFRWLALLGSLLVLTSKGEVAAGAPPTSKIEAGFAERDITPAVGTERPGGYGKSFHNSFHDPCKVRVAVFSDGTRRVALVGVDALMVSRSLVQAARAQIQERCGLAPEAVMIGASHSHSSGPTGMIQPGDFDFASEEVQRLAYEASSQADPGYLLRVQQAIVEAVVWADRTKVPAQLGFGSGREEQVSFNRRLRMRNGVTWSHPGVGNPEILDYAGPIDPEVGVVAAWDLQGELLGVMVNFACHATTNPVIGGISANWIYYLEKMVQAGLATRAPVVFLQGASGDVTQMDNLATQQSPSPEEWARLVGGRVGAEAVKVVLGMAKTTTATIDHRQNVWRIKRRIPSPERVAQSWEVVRQKKGGVVGVFAKEIVLLDAWVQREPTCEVEVQAVQVGPAVFVSNPAEYFVENGLWIKRESPFPFTFPVTLANGCTGYVPTEESFGPGGGGYETRLTFYSNLEITAGTQMAEAGIALAHQLSPDPPPKRPRPSPFRAPWALGSVPPELQ